MTLVFCVHFHRDTGAIRNWGVDDGSSESFAGADYSIVHFEQWLAIDPAHHRIDPVTLALVALTPAEMLEDMQPEIVAAIAAELALTDGYMVPDRPLTDQARADWAAYRQALRDLSGDAEAMLDAWPLRPDGTDAAAGFISRLREIK